MSNIYIFGHRKPDTDSVVSAIALSYLKNELGIPSTTYVNGEINTESAFVLEHFKINKPEILDNVKLQIKDLNYRKGCFISETSSVIDAYNYMVDNSISSVPIVDNKNTYIGSFSMKDIAKNSITGSYKRISTSFSNLESSIKCKTILKFNDEITGTVIPVLIDNDTFINASDINKETILLVGDRNSIIDYAIQKGVHLIILTCSVVIEPATLEIAKNNKVNIVQIEDESFNLYNLALCNYIKSCTYEKNIICFNENDYVTSLTETANKMRYSYYPVINDKKQCLGLLKYTDVNDRNQKQVILVDHNSFGQSAEGIEEAEILEVIDHHNIGNIGTSLPINFRTMPVGSTSTIIYQMFKENDISIPPEIAGILASGIISDTLLFKSPTTTQIDKVVLSILSDIANIDYEKYGIEMLKAGSSLKGKTKEEILFSDFKNYETDGNKFGIGQFTTLNIDEIIKDKEEYIELLNKTAKNNDYDVVLFFATDIIKNGSFVFFNNKAEEILKIAYGLKSIKQGEYLEGIVSRKKQMVPNIMKALNLS